MKMFGNAFSSAVDALANWKFVGRKSGGKIRSLDYGILEVAMMVSALDGAISTSEISAFEKLFSKCRGYTPTFSKTVFDRAIRKAGYMMALATTGVYTEKERVAAFVEEAVKSLPGGFVDGAPQDVRRAFVMWVSMAMADGDYSAVERNAIGELKKRLAEIKLDRADSAMMAWISAYPGYGAAIAGSGKSSRAARAAVKLLDDGFLDKVEEVILSKGKSKGGDVVESAITALIKG